MMIIHHKRFYIQVSFLNTNYLYEIIWFKVHIQPIAGTLTSTTTPGQSRSGSNGNEGVTFNFRELEDPHRM